MLRIGEVVRRLSDEFPDISISKIRFLEDEGLLAPQRTRGGYRLFSEDDLERLTTILRLQRDEFLPLRVIRDELSAPGVVERKRRRPAGLSERVQEIDFDELCRRGGAARAARRAGPSLAQRRAPRCRPAGPAGPHRARAGAERAAALARRSRCGERVIDLRSKIREVPDFPTPG